MKQEPEVDPERVQQLFLEDYRRNGKLLLEQGPGRRGVLIEMARSAKKTTPHIEEETLKAA